MAILDWPTTEGFQPMRPVLVGASSPKSSFIGAYTGERTESSRSADRMVMEMMLPTTTAAIGRKRAAWIKSLASTGNQVRMPLWPQRYTRGTLSGSVTVGTTAAAGVRSLTLAGCKAAPNFLRYGSFEMDTNADGLADGWTSYSAGSAGTVGYALSGGTLGTNYTHGSVAQRVTATALAAGDGNRAGVVQVVTFTAGQFAVASAAVDVRATAGVTTVLRVDFYDSTPTLLAVPSTSATPGVGAFTRMKIEGIAVPATAVRADVYVWMANGTGAAALMDADAVQLEFNATATAYAGFPTALAGDVVGIGGNLLEVGPTDCTANDAGGMTLGLALPTLRSITSGAVVTTTNATGVWQLDEVNAPLFGYEAGPMQGPVSLSFRQVAQ